jgi:hypothetical protein
MNHVKGDHTPDRGKEDAKPAKYHTVIWDAGGTHCHAHRHGAHYETCHARETQSKGAPGRDFEMLDGRQLGLGLASFLFLFFDVCQEDGADEKTEHQAKGVHGRLTNDRMVTSVVFHPE